MNARVMAALTTTEQTLSRAAGEGSEGMVPLGKHPLPNPPPLRGRGWVAINRRLIHPLLASLLGTVSSVAVAAPQRIDISPPASEVGFRAYKIGLIPIDGIFTHFNGGLIVDPENKAFCQVDLRIEVASLETEDPALRPVITGPQFMDAASFPVLRFVGNCHGRDVAGDLAMHGVSRSSAFSLDWHPDSVIAEGHIVRADWGISAMPLLVGRTVQIRVSVPLPAQSSHHG
jgi:polyisoprenoid-binding protein YceI